MTDLDLKLLPQSKISFDLGYSHDSNGGMSFPRIIREPKRSCCNRPRSDRYLSLWGGLAAGGADPDRLQRIFTHDKSDTYDYLNSFPYALSNGTPANLGISFDTANGIPCAAPLLAGNASIRPAICIRDTPTQFPTAPTCPPSN